MSSREKLSPYPEMSEEERLVFEREKREESELALWKEGVLQRLTLRLLLPSLENEISLDERCIVLRDALCDMWESDGNFSKEERKTFQKIIDRDVDWYRMRVTPEKLNIMFGALTEAKKLENAINKKKEHDAQEYRKGRQDPDYKPEYHPFIIPLYFFAKDAPRSVLQFLYFPEDILAYFGKVFEQDEDWRERAPFQVNSKILKEEELRNLQMQVDMGFSSLGQSSLQKTIEESKGIRSVVLEQRNETVDILRVFDCTEKEVAWSIADLQNKMGDGITIKAFVGQLVAEGDLNCIFPFFRLIPKEVEYIFTSFPKGRIHKERVRCSGRSQEEWRAIGNGQESRTPLDTRDLQNINENLRSLHDVGEVRPREVTAIRLRVNNLGCGFEKFGGSEIYIHKRAHALGLEELPLDACRDYRMQYTNQGTKTLFALHMKENPRVPLAYRHQAKNLISLDRSVFWHPELRADCELIFMSPEEK